MPNARFYLLQRTILVEGRDVVEDAYKKVVIKSISHDQQEIQP